MVAPPCLFITQVTPGFIYLKYFLNRLASAVLWNLVFDLFILISLLSFIHKAIPFTDMQRSLLHYQINPLFCITEQMFLIFLTLYNLYDFQLLYDTQTRQFPDSLHFNPIYINWSIRVNSLLLDIIITITIVYIVIIFIIFISNHVFILVILFRISIVFHLPQNLIKYYHLHTEYSINKIIIYKIILVQQLTHEVSTFYMIQILHYVSAQPAVWTLKI